MSGNLRREIYENLHMGQLKSQELSNRQSANCILDILDEYLQPKSVLDVGCGIGTWLAVVESRGIKDVRGVDGQWLNLADVVCNPANVQVCDLEVGFDLDRVFGLTICLEVAEHLSPQAAERFVASLVRHSSAVLFSAAIPFQGGHHHLNEQFLSYWEAIFSGHNYHPIDLLRPRIWDDKRVLWWLRQNIILFAHETLIEANEKLRRARDYTGPVSIVHPNVYGDRLRSLLNQVERLKQMETLLSKPGVYRTALDAEGRSIVTKIE